MKIAVALKWVADLDSVDIDPILGQVDASRLLYVLDPGAESALAVALAIATGETDPAMKAEISVYTVGQADADPAIRLALAAGVHRAVRLEAEARPAVTAAALARAMTKDGPFDLILLGSRSFDRGSGEVPSLLASELGLPIVTDATALTKANATDGTTWELEREVDRGTKEIVRVAAPAVFALGPDVARLGTASLPNFMKAQNAAIEVRRDEVTPLSTDPQVYERTELPLRPRTLSIRAQPPTGTPAERLASIAQGAAGARSRGKMVEGTPGEAADAIVTFLRDRGLLDPSS
jgi:electron transfer flavoprotein beta subunit